jgi:hypothetical protein
VPGGGSAHGQLHLVVVLEPPSTSKEGSTAPDERGGGAAQRGFHQAAYGDGGRGGEAALPGRCPRAATTNMEEARHQEGSIAIDELEDARRSEGFSKPPPTRKRK